MSSIGKTIPIIITVLVITAAVWWWIGGNGHAPVQVSEQTATTTPGILQTQSSDTSNAALDKDTAALDVQISGLDSDTAAIDKSLNDQPATTTAQ